MSYKKQLGEHFNSWTRKNREMAKAESFDVSHLLDFAEYHQLRMGTPICKDSGEDGDFVEKLKEMTSLLFELDWERIEGPSRKDELVNARSAFAFIMKKHGRVLKEIGSHLMGRDHSTVINLLDRVNANPLLLNKIHILMILMLYKEEV